MKTCTLCNKTLDESMFHKSTTSPDGLQSRCKSCRSTLSKEYYKENYSDITASRTPEKRKAINMKHKYNLDISSYNAMLDEQNNTCAICHQPMMRVCVDHSHETGKVRGLLCSNCNTILGMAKDNITTLANAIKYLDQQ